MAIAHCFVKLHFLVIQYFAFRQQNAISTLNATEVSS